MARIAAIFDTNLYRTLSDADFAVVRELEAQRSAIGYANYFVVAELLSHVADPSDSGFRSALAGLRRLHAHCTQFDGSRYLTRFGADSEDQICYTLFGQPLPRRGHQDQIYGNLVGTIASASSPADWRHIQPHLDELRSHVLATEEQFRTDVWNGVIARTVPDATSWRALAENRSLRDQFLQSIGQESALRFAASLLIKRAADGLGHTLAASDLDARIDRTLAYFSFPLRFYASVLRRVALDGISLDRSKHVNSIWDMQICHSTGPDAFIEGARAWLVTNDAAMLAAARDCDATGFVMDLAEYQRRLAYHDVNL